MLIMNYITCYRHYTNKRSDPQQRSIIFYPRNIYYSPPWHHTRQDHRDRCRPAGITGREFPAQGVGMQSIKCNTLNRLPCYGSRVNRPRSCPVREIPQGAGRNLYGQSGQGTAQDTAQIFYKSNGVYRQGPPPPPRSGTGQTNGQTDGRQGTRGQGMAWKNNRKK